MVGLLITGVLGVQGENTERKGWMEYGNVVYFFWNTQLASADSIFVAQRCLLAPHQEYRSMLRLQVRVFVCTQGDTDEISEVGVMPYTQWHQYHADTYQAGSELKYQRVHGGSIVILATK